MPLIFFFCCYMRHAATFFMLALYCFACLACCHCFEDVRVADTNCRHADAYDAAAPMLMPLRCLRRRDAAFFITPPCRH